MDAVSIDKHFEARGVRLSDDNSLPPKERTQRSVKRLIAAVRAAEAEFNDELRDSNELCRTAQAQVIELQAALQKCEAELRRYRVSERLENLENLTVSDRQQLLEVS